MARQRSAGHLGHKKSGCEVLSIDLVGKVKIKEKSRLQPKGKQTTKRDHLAKFDAVNF